jgi:hypothetical protein
MACENNIIEVKSYIQLIIPKLVSTAMTTSIIGDVHTNLFYTNYKHTNHTMETCRNKKEEIIISVTKVIIHNNKNVRPMQFPCHVCGLIGHKMVECRRRVEMQKMFKDKNVTLKCSHHLVLYKLQACKSHNRDMLE